MTEEIWATYPRLSEVVAGRTNVSDRIEGLASNADWDQDGFAPEETAKRSM